MRYTVKQVSQLTGVSPDVLRAWERRYRVVIPERTEGGYRLYDEDDVARLRHMAALVSDGSPASLAAEQVRAQPVRAQPVQTPSARPSGWTPALPPDSALPPREALVAHGRALDRTQLEGTLDEVFAAGSFEKAWDGWLAPALERLGEAWETGEVDVAGEHFVSAAVHGRLSRAFEAAGSTHGAPVVAVGLAPGTFHELAALAFATCLRRRGVDVRYLGRDLPVEDWVGAVRRLSPAAVAISVPLDRDRPAVQELVRALGAIDPAPRVYVGGDGVAHWEGDLPAAVLRGSVTEGADELARRLAD